MLFSFICFPKCSSGRKDIGQYIPNSEQRRTWTLRGVANTNDALSYLAKMHRSGAFDEGRALDSFRQTISSFRRYGTEFPEDAVVPRDPQKILGCPGARNRILSIELPIFQLNSCLGNIVASCGKTNDEEGRGHRLEGILNCYRAYRDSPLDPIVKEKLDKILSVTGISKEYRFEIKLKRLGQRAALDALDSIDLSRPGTIGTGLLVRILTGALKVAIEKGQIQPPLPPPEKTAVSICGIF